VCDGVFDGRAYLAECGVERELVGVQLTTGGLLNGTVSMPSAPT
jgi:hypothetical protein